MAEPVEKRKVNASIHRARSGTRPPGPGLRAGVGVAGAKMIEMEMMAQRVWEGGLLEGLSGGVSGIGGTAVVRTRSDVAEQCDNKNGGSGRHGPRGPAQSPTGVELRVSPLAISSLLPAEFKPAGGLTSPPQTTASPTTAIARYTARPKPAQNAASPTAR